MRTTLDIEDDVLVAAKEMTRREHLTAGQVNSRLARLVLTARLDQQPFAQTVAGFRPLPARGVFRWSAMTQSMPFVSMSPFDGRAAGCKRACCLAGCRPHAPQGRNALAGEIGRASCRERV